MSGYLIYTVGLPGSGKTTRAKHIVDDQERDEAVMISRDDIRMTLFGYKTGMNGGAERLVTKVQEAMIKESLAAGLTVVVHDCNLRAAYRKRFVKLAEESGSSWHQLDLTDVPLQTCLSRNALRDEPVPEYVITDWHKKFIKPLKGAPMPVPEAGSGITKGETYVPDTQKRKAILVDIDGTVANHEGVRGPYDTSRYHLDYPHHDVIEIVRDYHYRLGYDIIFMSGRDEKFRGVTEEWLYQEVKVPIAGLFMRPEGDTRPDNVVKLELFNKNVRDSEWCVKFALDDRDRVVKNWRSIGLRTLQVAEGNF